MKSYLGMLVKYLIQLGLFDRGHDKYNFNGGCLFIDNDQNCIQIFSEHPEPLGSQLEYQYVGGAHRFSGDNLTEDKVLAILAKYFLDTFIGAHEVQSQRIYPRDESMPVMSESTIQSRPSKPELTIDPNEPSLFGDEQYGGIHPWMTWFKTQYKDADVNVSLTHFRSRQQLISSASMPWMSDNQLLDIPCNLTTDTGYPALGYIVHTAHAARVSFAVAHKRAVELIRKDSRKSPLGGARPPVERINILDNVSDSRSLNPVFSASDDSSHYIPQVGEPSPFGPKTDSYNPNPWIVWRQAGNKSWYELQGISYGGGDVIFLEEVVKSLEYEKPRLYLAYEPPITTLDGQLSLGWVIWAFYVMGLATWEKAHHTGLARMASV